MGILPIFFWFLWLDGILHCFASSRTVDGAKYLGCFYSSEKKIGLPYAKLELSKMTLDTCMENCRQNGHPYAAIRKGQKCSCGQNYVTYKKTNEKYCMVNCPGDKETYCGGSGKSLQLYRIYVACYKDSSKERHLPYIFSETSWMMINKCVLSCRSRFRIYAGLENGNQCWCGDIIGVHPKVSDSECNMPCLNKDITCGGRWKIQIYAVTYSVFRETPLGVYEGCFYFYDTKRSKKWNVFNLSTTKEVSQRVMSISRCSYQCKRKPRYKYAGVVRGNACYCGTWLNFKKVLKHEDRCNLKCTENTNHFCGGAYAMQVYNLRPLGYPWSTFGFEL